MLSSRPRRCRCWRCCARSRRSGGTRYALAKQTGLKSGTLYPILIRLADRGLMEARWEDEQPAGRPRRHLYRLTPEGLARAGTALAAAASSARPAAPRARPAPSPAGVAPSLARAGLPLRQRLTERA